MTDWTDSLQQASFRGIPFAVTAGVGRFGRRVAVHEYPNRDKPWPEDMGRAARRFTVTGFLVTDSMIYGGGDVIGQREQMVAAAEAVGSADLVHPTYGRLKVVCVGLDVAESYREGRCFELVFSFIEAGDRQFPAATTATGDAVKSAADGARSAAAGDFASTLNGVRAQLSSVTAMVDSAGRFAQQAQAAAHDATSLFNLSGQLSGSFGRFAGGGSFTGGVSGLIGQAARLSSAVSGAAANFAATTSGFGLGGSTATEIADGAHVLAASVRGAAGGAGDAVRLLGGLAAFGR